MFLTNVMPHKVKLQRYIKVIKLTVYKSDYYQYQQHKLCFTRHCMANAGPIMSSISLHPHSNSPVNYNKPTNKSEFRNTLLSLLPVLLTCWSVLHYCILLITTRAYARAVLGVVILSVRPSVCLSHSWIVTKLNDALQIF